MKSDKSESLWQSILEIIRRGPEQFAAVELESIACMLLIILDYEISSNTIAVIYHSAVEGESLDLLIDRLEHEKSKMS